MYIEILENFLIPLIENWFSDNEIIFVKEQNGLKLFFRKGIENNMASKQFRSKSNWKFLNHTCFLFVYDDNHSIAFDWKFMVEIF